VKNISEGWAEGLCAIPGLIRCGNDPEVLKRAKARKIVDQVKRRVREARANFQFVVSGVGASGSLRGEVWRLSWRGSRMARKPSSSGRSAGGGLALLLRFSGGDGSL
jgi:hypothetical protein